MDFIRCILIFHFVFYPKKGVKTLFNLVHKIGFLDSDQSEKDSGKNLRNLAQKGYYILKPI